MTIKRQKKAKKNINFYKHNFSFREPFQILIDGTFCQAALKNKIQIKEQMPKYLMGEVQLCTTKWVGFSVLVNVTLSWILTNDRFFLTLCPTVVRWRNLNHWKTSMVPNSSCSGIRLGTASISRTLSLRLSVCTPCWKGPIHTTTLLPHR